MRRDFDQERVDEMNRLRFEEDLSITEIGKRFGVSRQRIHQLIGNTSREGEIADFVSMKLDEMGIENEVTHHKKAHSILLKNGNVVHVKVAKEGKDGYRFTLRSRVEGRPDFYIFVLLTEEEAVYLVMPESETSVSLVVTFPPKSNSSKYALLFRDRFDLLR